MSLLRAIGNFILIMVLCKSLILSYVFPSGGGFHTVQYNTIQYNYFTSFFPSGVSTINLHQCHFTHLLKIRLQLLRYNFRNC